MSDSSYREYQEEPFEEDWEGEDDRPRRSRRRRRNQTRQDEEHLNLLAVFYYVLGGLGVVGALFPLIYLVLGIFFLTEADKFQRPPNSPPPPLFIGWMFMCIGGGGFILGEIMAICTIYSGRLLQTKQGYIFSMIIACILCLQIPFGTALGVFTLIVLSRDSVKRIYGRA